MHKLPPSPPPPPPPLGRIFVSFPLLLPTRHLVFLPSLSLCLSLLPICPWQRNKESSKPGVEVKLLTVAIDIRRERESKSLQHCVLRYTGAKYRFLGEIPVKIPVRLSIPVPSPSGHTTERARLRQQDLTGKPSHGQQTAVGTHPGRQTTNTPAETELTDYKQTSPLTCLLVGCLTSQQQASVSQGPICSDNFTCCHTEIEVADQTFYLTQSQYTDTGPTSPSADPITPGAWQGSHWSANF